MQCIILFLFNTNKCSNIFLVKTFDYQNLCLSQPKYIIKNDNDCVQNTNLQAIIIVYQFKFYAIVCISVISTITESLSGPIPYLLIAVTTTTVPLNTLSVSDRTVSASVVFELYTNIHYCRIVAHSISCYIQV